MRLVLPIPLTRIAAMNRAGLVLLLASLSVAAMVPVRAVPGADAVTIDLAQWTPPDIATVGNDPSAELVKYGYALVTDTANQIGPTVADERKRFAGNNLACGNCHLQAGRQPYAMPLVGAWQHFPRYRAREGSIVTLQERINGCMERSLNGEGLPLDSREMQAFSAYVRWLSTGIPSGARLVGAGTLRVKEPERAADPVRGAGIYAATCAPCHGADGRGQRAHQGAGYQFPPLWGPDSFNDGAGMDRLLIAAAFATHNMPIGTTFDAPALSDEDGYDVAAYVISQKRPAKANLDRDFPNRLQKPVDAAYGPYADGFSREQHEFGPFGPIRARLRELAASSWIADPGGPDNGSQESDFTAK